MVLLEQANSRARDHGSIHLVALKSCYCQHEAANGSDRDALLWDAMSGCNTRNQELVGRTECGDSDQRSFQVLNPADPIAFCGSDNQRPEVAVHQRYERADDMSLQGR